MMLFACVGAAETMPSHGPTEKDLTCCNSLPTCEGSFLYL